MEWISRIPSRISITKRSKRFFELKMHIYPLDNIRFMRSSDEPYANG